MVKYLLLFALTSVSSYSQLRAVKYMDGSQALNGYSIEPIQKSDTRPGVLILPAWKGIDAHSKQVASQLSEMGYYVFIADIYGEGNYPTDSKQAGEKSGYYKKNYKSYQLRILLALEQLVKAGANSDNIAIIGYCFGGTGALEAARANFPVKGVVSFHGGLNRDKSRAISAIAPKVLVLHGAEDPYVPQDDIIAFQKEMKDSNADWQMIYYADAVHAFTEKSAGNEPSKGAAYNENADKRSWEHMKVLFAEVLR